MHASCRATRVVSIPRSGFCLFERRTHHTDSLFYLLFQSLGRDSVSLSLYQLEDVGTTLRVSIPRSGFCLFELWVECKAKWGDKSVSIPRSGFCLFEPRIVWVADGVVVVSIPRSGFCLFERDHSTARVQEWRGFNPSVGILSL